MEAQQGHGAPDRGEREPEFTPRASRYALGLLLVVYVFNFIDRSILSILQESIKQDLDLSDTQLGILGGIAFAALYSTLGIPIARLADRSNRVRIIAIAVFVWSGMTAITGLARSYPALLLARIGVGIGEAGCSPPAHSLISDYFQPERRATALSIYALGIPIGGAFGVLFGGWLDEFLGWRTAFMVVGLPGLVLAAIVHFTLKEPTRGYWDGARSAHAQQESFREVFSLLLSRRSFLHLSFAGALHAFYGYGAAYFNPVFFLRVHEIPAGELGTWLAAIGLTTGALGTFLGGVIGDWIGKRDVRWYLWVPAIATAIGIPFSFVLYFWPEGRQALLLYAFPAILGGMYLGPTFAMTQALVPARMRAMASAVLLLIMNLIGLGLGPSVVGFLSDVLEPTYGIESIRYALIWVVVPCSAWSVFHYLLGARHLRADLAANEEN